MKNIIVFGSTGSIGLNTLHSISNLDSFNVLGLSTNNNIGKLVEQIKKYHPKYISIVNNVQYYKFCLEQKNLIDQFQLTVFSGEEGLLEILDVPYIDFVVVALVGSIGLKPILKAIKKGIKIAVANKEPIVIAGDIILEESNKHKNKIFPIDSEHSAIYQCLMGEDVSFVKKIILTASGGPFYSRKYEDFKSITVEDALNHPRWKMGKKITVDSATLMNKGFEVIEAHYLFEKEIEKIDVIIHREAIIHSLVEFVDGSIKANLSNPDMKIPIKFALTYPNRFPIDNISIDFSKLKQLNFDIVDYKKFPCLKLAFDVIREKNGYPIVLNAVNEILVEKFLDRKISFLDIQNNLIKIIDKFKPTKISSLDDVLELDKFIRISTLQQLIKLS